MNATLKELVFGTFATALCVVAGPASADLLWDNNIEPDGFSGRAISPPGFPNIRVADDFIIPTGKGWSIESARFDIVEDIAFTDDGLLTVTFYADTDGNGPGDIIAERTVDVVKMDNERQFFGRDDFTYSAEFDGVALGAGTYWVSARSPGGTGAGTNYWLTSNGGPDGAGTSTGYVSLNAGITWQNEGAGWQHAFEIGGVIPAPGALALLGLGGLVGARRRRHSRRQLMPVQ